MHQRIKIAATVIVEVALHELDNQPTFDPHFIFEENGCPGTGPVGRAIEDAIEKANLDGTCWGCTLLGTNKVLSVTIVPDPSLDKSSPLC